MKIIVTGGSGFIGSHLVERLLDDGHEVIVIDNLLVGKPQNLPINKNLQIHVYSVLDDIGQLFEGVGLVYHLAALTRPQESIVYPNETTLTNVLGTVSVLEHCRRYKVPRMVFMSSTSLYGAQDTLPTPETAQPNPMSPYALTKLIGEEYCKLYQKIYGLEVNCVRPFNVYGSRQSPNGGYASAVSKFIDLLSKGKQPYITGDGTQSRDFVYVADVVDLLVKAGFSEVYGEVFNAGSGVSTSINEIYLIISKIMKRNIKPNYIDPVFEPMKTLGDMSKAKNLLDWEPKTNLLEGLRKTIEETI